jgi:hypothetical protein
LLLLLLLLLLMMMMMILLLLLEIKVICPFEEKLLFAGIQFSKGRN